MLVLAVSLQKTSGHDKTDRGGVRPHPMAPHGRERTTSVTARRRVYLYARDPARIMVAARKAVGLSQRDVACRLAISPARVSRMERGAASIAASEWFYFCDLVCLDCDSISTGYSRKWHLARLSVAIERGTYKKMSAASVGFVAGLQV